MAKQEQLVIDNIGPIEHLELDALGGTITVFRGLNGEGKSTALDVVDAITRGSGKLESRDNTTGGHASFGGVTIKVGRGGANRRTGDLVVTAVEDRLSIADFVEPNIKDPYAADGKRLRALISLNGAKPDPTIYHNIAGGKAAFDEVVKPESLEALDPITLSERIKRDFEAASRIQTTRAERLWGEIKAKNAANEGLALTAEHDASVLQRRLEMWLAESSALAERSRSYAADQSRRKQASEAIDRARANSVGLSIPDASNEVLKAESEELVAVTEMVDVRTEVTKLEQQLAEAKTLLSMRQQACNSARIAVDAAKKVHQAAKERESTLAEWQKTLDQAAVIAPSAEAIEASANAVEQARKDHEQGVLIRAALQRQQEAAELDADREAAVKRAEFLREAARSVLDVLAETVKGLVPGLKLNPELRIIVPHKKRVECFYADLSHGERWKMALDIAVAAFERRGERGVLAIPQEAWEGLDGRNRKVIADHIATTDLIVFTAEAERSVKSKTKGIEVEVLQAKA